MALMLVMQSWSACRWLRLWAGFSVAAALCIIGYASLRGVGTWWSNLVYVYMVLMLPLMIVGTMDCRSVGCVIQSGPPFN